MADYRSRIKTLTEAVIPRAIQWRRAIHAFPELAYEEVQTAALVTHVLNALGLEVQTGIAQTGVVALLKGRDEGDCIALRADMDALPIDEATALSFRSEVPGKMHACGHDFHTANLLAVAAVLAEMKDELRGSVKFIFQPSEEKMPSGAAAMIAAGVLQNPDVKKIYGMHVHPELAAGEVGFCAGKFMASADEIYITAIGKGGHAAQPKAFVSPLMMAAEVLLELQRLTDPELPVVLSFGKIQAEGATNIIPEKAYLAGTLRCFDEAIREEMHEKIEVICSQTAQRYGGKFEVHILKGYPVLKNDEELTNRARIAAAAQCGSPHVHQLPKRMGAEDFAYYTQEIAACFFRVGTSKPGMEGKFAIHTPHFEIDETAFSTSIEVMARIALESLNDTHAD
ncbi:MAG: M20 family metallopeptidase [Chitinophagales bacterium]